MAQFNSFRVVLDLSRSFQDHRQSARVLIRADFKTIQDLHNHISNLFGIQDFYLTSGEHYLPLLEDIGILSNEERICVIPKKQENVAATVSSNNEIVKGITSTNPQQNIRVREKSKDDTVRLSRTILTPLITYNKYRPPQLITRNYLETRRNNIIKIEVLDKGTSMEPINLSEKEQGEDLSKSVKREILTLEANNNAFSDNNISINAVPNDKKHENLLINDLPRDFPNNDNNVKVDTLKRSLSEYLPNDKIQKSLVKPNCSNIDEKQDTSKINSVKNETTFNESSKVALTLDTSNLSTTENDNNFTSDTSVPIVINKRKRIRTHRKRKPKEPVLEIEKKGPPKEHLNSLLFDRPQSTVHIRFDTPEKIGATEDDSVAAVDNEEIIINKWKHRISEAPLLNSIPKNGDIMAFTILKIGENYTPQITNNIIGKVETYNPETEEITLNILEGLEELLPPSSGKFGLDCEENGKSTTRSFVFTKLILPRLLHL